MKEKTKKNLILALITTVLGLASMRLGDIIAKILKLIIGA